MKPISDKHREIADYIMNRIKPMNFLDEYEIRKIGGDVYDVIKWLKEYQVLEQSRTGQPFVKGKNFYNYNGLDELEKLKEPTTNIVQHITYHNAVLNNGTLIGNQSLSSSSIELTPKTIKQNSKLTIKKVFTVVSVIIGCIAGMIAIYEFVIKNWLVTP